MNIIERAQAFVEHVVGLRTKDAEAWRECPRCGRSNTCRWGSYPRRPQTLKGPQEIRVPRHYCKDCRKTYSEESPLVGRGRWYGREVQRAAIDHWQHGGMSLRRAAETVRSWIGHQERWLIWHPWVKKQDREPCSLHASTLHRWLDEAGQRAQETVSGQMKGLGGSGLLGADGLWARLRGGGQRVVLMLSESVSGLSWPPVVQMGEESAAAWGRLFARAQEAGMDLKEVLAVTSDGAQGLMSHLRRSLGWVYQQRCLWHLWRNVGPEVSRAAEEAGERKEEVKEELGQLIHGVMDAESFEEGEEQLARLRDHPQGEKLWQVLNHRFDEILAHLLPGNEGLMRVSPEWVWRGFRLRLSRGRNHGSEQRLERASLVWSIYHNFTPAQDRRELRRHYRWPGRSPLEVAGASSEGVSYLDALEV
jgi:transposase-like protein